MAHVVLQLRHRHAGKLRGGLVLIDQHVCVGREGQGELVFVRELVFV